MSARDPNVTLPSGQAPEPDAKVETTPAPTLYAARLSDPRERSAQPRERSRGRGPTRAEPTSDVTRFRGVLAATFTGAGGALAAALLFPPAGGHVSPGPLSRPHEKAKLECASCHRADGETARSGQADVPEKVCTGCHGAHPSTRRGHEKARAQGAMRCATCHAIHASDQGVSFSPSAAPIRFAPGVEATLTDLDFHPARPATVAFPRAGSCAACHDPASPSDPIARCLLAGQARLGPDRPIVCFDEHQPALPRDDAPSAPGRGRAALAPAPGSGVCAGQHTPDRAVVWEAAREAAALVPTLSRGGAGGAPGLWTGVGLAVAGLAYAAVQGASAVTARRKKKAVSAPQKALLEPAARVRLPQINTGTCLGCYACVDACPYDVLEIERYVAVVARPEACCGLTLCEQRCPNGSLVITDGEPIGERPRLKSDLSSLDVPGLYLAGDVTGLPLIKNAIHQGAHAVAEIAKGLQGTKRRGDALDLIIIGAGPAGISAALRAKELGLTFEVIEQGSVAQSIQSFPRGKLVFDQPLDLPVAGKLWLQESSKEELLSHWLRIVRKEQLPIHQDTRMTAIERDLEGLFHVTTEPREGGGATARRCRRVLLAIGQRGTPRRLPFELAPAVEARVHYHLSDAKSFEGKRVVVVGLGDVAMEAAIALSRQPGTTVTVVHRAEGFTRGKSRNITEMKRLAESGRVEILWQREITALDPERVTFGGAGRASSTLYDAVLVLIGSIPPSSVLRAAGVRTVGDVAPLAASV
jgi:thioredoxin reductase